MKKLMLFLSLFACSSLLSAQDYFQLQSRSNPEKYLHNEWKILQLGPLGAPGWHSAHWTAIELANAPGFVNIRNRFGNDFYLHNQHGSIQVGALGAPGWHSAQWKLIEVPGTHYVRIQNRWKPNEYLIDDYGTLGIEVVHSASDERAHWKKINLNETVFLFFGDPQVTGDNKDGDFDYDDKMGKFRFVINKLNSFDETNWPVQINSTLMNFDLQGKPINPQFMVMGGDLTQWGGGWGFGMDGDALRLRWADGSLMKKFLYYFDRDEYGDHAINLPMYLGYGNHDLNHDYTSNTTETDLYRENMRKYLEVKHEGSDAQVPVGNFDSESGSFSWDAGGVHFVQLHRFGGDDIDNPRQDGQTRPNENYLEKDYQETDHSLEWLKADLEATGKGKHIVIFQHYGWDDFGLGMVKNSNTHYEWWTPKEVEELDKILKDYKVTRFHGHSHANQFYFHEDNFTSAHHSFGNADPVFCVQAANPSKYQETTTDAYRTYFDHAGFLVVRVTNDLVEVAYADVDLMQVDPQITFTGGYRIQPSLNGKANQLTSSAPNDPQEAMYDYSIEFKTGSSTEGSSAFFEETAGTDAEVHLRMIGTVSHTSKHYMNELIDRDAFEANQTDKVVIRERDIGDISQLSISKDGSGAGPDWFVDKITVSKKRVSNRTTTDYPFYINDWVKSNKSYKPGTPPINYYVQIQTSDVADAGTDANVYITIYGDQGNTKEFRLNGLLSGNAFERLDLDEAMITAKDVGNISKIKIRHDNSHTGPGWHLSNVKIYKENKNSTPVFFPANRWLISPNLSADLTPGTPKVDLKVTVRTSDIGSAGTDANVYITIFGTNGNTGEHRLNGFISGNAFEAGDSDVVTLRNMPDIGVPNQVFIRHDNSYAGAGWHLKSVTVHYNSNQNSKTFSCNCWIESGQLAKILR